MSTELTNPISNTEVITTQQIDMIILNIEAREIEFHITDRDGTGEQVGGKRYHFEKFADMGPTQQGNIRDVLKNTRQYARSIGALGAGTDTDPINAPAEAVK